jgi:cell division septation protein DedD
MASSQDTEITLGTGKMLGLFFGLVAMCALFFGLGFKMGKGSASPIAVLADGTSTSIGGARPAAAVKPVNSTSSDSSPDVAFYKSANQKPPEDRAAPASDAKTSDSKPADPANPPDPPDPTAVLPVSNYYVQVAAVSRQEDGEALVEALKKKQYAAFSTTGPDKLYHIQVGPFTDIKSAEDARAKLTNDGYNPILKK